MNVSDLEKVNTFLNITLQMELKINFYYMCMYMFKSQ